jgi:hypothetical protein
MLGNAIVASRVVDPILVFMLSVTCLALMGVVTLGL